MATKLIEVTDKTFPTAVKAAPGLILVEFGGDWCPPCVALEPIIEQLATEWAGKATFYKLDTEASPDTPAELGIRGLPTVMLFRDGKILERLVGYQARKTLLAALQKHEQR